MFYACSFRQPPAKKSRLKSWTSQVRFSWVAMALLFTVIIASIVVIVLQYNIHKSKVTAWVSALVGVQ